MSFIGRTGPWGTARRILASSPARIQKAVDVATLQEAHYFRRLVVEGLREQAPGGKAFKPLAPLTLALRKLKNFRGTKALLVRGDLRNSITVNKLGPGAAFVGVLRTAKGRNGQPLANVADLNENGSRPIIIRITQKMRELLGRAAALAGKGSDGKSPTGGGGGSSSSTGIMVIRIPPRPFLRPVLDEHFKPEDVRPRFLARVGRALAGDFGQLGIPIPDGGGQYGPIPGAPPSGGKPPPVKPPRVKDPKRVAAALKGWRRRRGGM
jgi:hypothetical protein